MTHILTIFFTILWQFVTNFTLFGMMKNVEIILKNVQKEFCILDFPGLFKFDGIETLTGSRTTVICLGQNTETGRLGFKIYYLFWTGLTGWKQQTGSRTSAHNKRSRTIQISQD